MTEVQSEEKKQDPIAAEEKLVGGKERSETEENGVDPNESDGESSEEELGLLERPVEILDRKRDRKTTDRLSLEKYSQPKTPKEELDFTQATGTKFGDIPFIKHQIDKTNAEDLRTLHRLLFLKASKVTLVKKNIRTFCGYPFEKDSIHYKRADNSIDRIVLPHLKFLCDIMGLEKRGDKLAIKERMLEFFLNPADTGKQIPAKKAKSDKKTKSKKKSKTPKKEMKTVEEVNENSDDDASDKEEGDEGDEKEEKKKASPNKKTSKKESPKKKDKKKTPKQPAIKLPVPKNKKNATPKKRKAEDESDDEPLLKKTKGEPSDAELKKVISGILQGADLEEITMKTVVKQVYDKYSEFDLTPRKDFIKNTVKEIIS